MADIDLHIQFLPPDPAGGVPAFRPGETVQGSIQITPAADVNCRHLFVRLRWQTEGRGDQDRGVGAEEDLYQGQLRGGVPFYQRFHFTAPNEPWSYSGHYVSIVWQVEVTVDLPLARDAQAAEKFILAPDSRR